jgi:nucleoside-diphosphate-sugar epimerase
VLDNWNKDTYDWEKEIVLITGGAGGIGGSVVKLLAEKGIKVVVLDVIPMTFDARMPPPLSSSYFPFFILQSN